MGEETRFGGRTIALCGILAGAGIALGMTYMMLVFGSELGAAVQTWIIIISLVGGGLIALTASFFGLVMPNKVNR